MARMSRAAPWWCASRRTPAEIEIEVTPRIGITQSADLPLRFVMAGNEFVSGEDSDRSTYATGCGAGWSTSWNQRDSTSSDQSQ